MFLTLKVLFNTTINQLDNKNSNYQRLILGYIFFEQIYTTLLKVVSDNVISRTVKPVNADLACLIC